MTKKNEKALQTEVSPEILYEKERSKIRKGLGSVAQTAEKEHTETHLKKLNTSVQSFSKINHSETSHNQTEYVNENIDSQLMKDIFTQYSNTCEKTHENKIKLTPIPETMVSPIAVENGFFIGRCQTGCLEGRFRLNKDQFEFFLIKLENQLPKNLLNQKNIHSSKSSKNDSIQKIPRKNPEDQLKNNVSNQKLSSQNENHSYKTDYHYENIATQKIPEKNLKTPFSDEYNQSKIILGSTNYKDLLGYDEFCDLECGKDCDLLEGKTLEFDDKLILEGIGEENNFLDRVDDETLEQLEEKLLTLKREKRINQRNLTAGEKIALAAILSGGGVFLAENVAQKIIKSIFSPISISKNGLEGVLEKSIFSKISSKKGVSNFVNSVITGASTLTVGSFAWPLIIAGSSVFITSKVIRKIRQVQARRKAEQQKLGFNKQEYKQFRKNRRKQNKILKKEEKQAYIDEYSPKIWRKKKRTDRRNARSERKIKFHKAKLGIKETRKKIKKLKKSQKKIED